MQPDGRPTGTPHMFHRGNAKHPALSSTSEHSAHLGCRCTSSREKKKKKKRREGCCTALHACLDGVCEWLCLSISTEHSLVLYTEAEHTCVYVYNHTAWGRSVSFAGGRREGERRNFTGADTVIHWEPELFKKAWRLNIYEGRGVRSGQRKTNTDNHRCPDN